MRVAIVIPALDESATILAALERLAPLRRAGVLVVLADGGSRDDTVMLAGPHVDRIVVAPRGRAAQMNAGAREARESSADLLLFLHVDTRLPDDAIATLVDSLARSQSNHWGRFDVHIEGRSRWLPVIAAMMNARSRMTGVATGDQAIFVRADLFHRLGGYADIALMEDVELSRRLRRHSRPLCLRQKVVTSGRRWDRHGAWRTMALMWRLRAAFWLGADPDALARRYGYAPRDKTA